MLLTCFWNKSLQHTMKPFGLCVTVSLQPRLLRQRNVQSSHAGCACDHSATEELHLWVKPDIQWHGEPRPIVPRMGVTVFIWLSVDWQINDYVAGYHDGVLLFGKVLRERILSQTNPRKASDVPLSDNPFGNASFYGAPSDCTNSFDKIEMCFFFCFCFRMCLCLHTGMGGHYVLDEYGDRDVNFSIIYTSTLTGKVAYCCSLNWVFIFQDFPNELKVWLNTLWHQSKQSKIVICIMLWMYLLKVLLCFGYTSVKQWTAHLGLNTLNWLILISFLALCHFPVWNLGGFWHITK